MDGKPECRDQVDAPVSGRRRYEPPQCRAVKLVTEEVLAIGCKFVGGTGSLGSCHLGSPCPTDGS